MNTQFDFVSNANGVMFLLSLVFIVGFIVLNEIMKPSPFKAVVRAVSEDIQEMRSEGMGRVWQLCQKATLAPLYVAVYVVSVPVLFAIGLLTPFGRVVSSVTSFGWNPIRAYFRGSKKIKKDK